MKIGQDSTYGMGLEVSTRHGTPVVHHGGHMFGFLSDMMWLPEHGVGAVVLTNSETGWALQGELVVGKSEKRTLTMRDAQHEYVFTEE